MEVSESLKMVLFICAPSLWNGALVRYWGCYSPVRRSTVTLNIDLCLVRCSVVSWFVSCLGLLLYVNHLMETAWQHIIEIPGGDGTAMNKSNVSNTFSNLFSEPTQRENISVFHSIWPGSYKPQWCVQALASRYSPGPQACPSQALVSGKKWRGDSTAPYT